MSSPAREGSANAGSSNGNLEEKPRLSEHEKKANHIASGITPIVQYCHCFLLDGIWSKEVMSKSILQSKSADKQFAKASIDSLSLFLDSKGKAEVKALC